VSALRAPLQATTRGTQTPLPVQSKPPKTYHSAAYQRGPERPTIFNSGRHPDAYCLAKSNRPCALHGPSAMVAFDLNAPPLLCRSAFRRAGTTGATGRRSPSTGGGLLFALVERIDQGRDALLDGGTASDEAGWEKPYRVTLLPRAWPWAMLQRRHSTLSSPVVKSWSVSRLPAARTAAHAAGVWSTVSGLSAVPVVPQVEHHG
jgi:hypothetical protein